MAEVFIPVPNGHTQACCHRQGKDLMLCTNGITACTFRQSLLEGICSVAPVQTQTEVVVCRMIKKLERKVWIPAYVFTSEHLDNRSSGHDGCFQKCRRKDSVVRMLGWEGVSDTVWWSDKHFVWSKQMHSVSVLVRVWIKLFPIPGYTANDLSFHPATLLPLRYTPVWSICCPHAHTLELEAWLCINMAKNVVFS